MHKIKYSLTDPVEYVLFAVIIDGEEAVSITSKSFRTGRLTHEQQMQIVADFETSIELHNPDPTRVMGKYLIDLRDGAIELLQTNEQEDSTTWLLVAVVKSENGRIDFHTQAHSFETTEIYLAATERFIFEQTELNLSDGDTVLYIFEHLIGSNSWAIYEEGIYWSGE